jgi:RNA polymerase sigma-70 factor (ECF subfamily)
MAADLDDLIAGVRAGDADAFSAIVEALADDVQAFVAARAPSAAMVDEVVQAAFVTAWEQFARFEARGSLAAWIKGIAHNHLREELRRQRRVHSGDGLAERLVVEDCLAELDAADAAEATAARDRRLRACVERLPPRTRQVVERRYWHDEPLADLAQRFHQPAEALAALLYRARKALLTCLGSADDPARDRP